MFKDALFAVVHGLTEFLPVSSSGHLVVFNKLLGGGGSVFFYLSLHLGTTLAIIVFFFSDIIKYLHSAEKIKQILIVTLITGGLGFIGKDFFESLFSITKVVAVALLCNGIILILANQRIKTAHRKSLNSWDTVIFGIFQSVAIIPGISRSGITISSLLFRGIDKEEAFKFSFIAAVPVIIGGFIMEYLRQSSVAISNFNSFNYYGGIAISFLTGLAALFLLRIFVKNSRLSYFGYYCLAGGILLFFS